MGAASAVYVRAKVRRDRPERLADLHHESDCSDTSVQKVEDAVYDVQRAARQGNCAPPLRAALAVRVSCAARAEVPGTGSPDPHFRWNSCLRNGLARPSGDNDEIRGEDAQGVMIVIFEIATSAAAAVAGGVIVFFVLVSLGIHRDTLTAPMSDRLALGAGRQRSTRPAEWGESWTRPLSASDGQLTPVKQDGKLTEAG